MTDSEDYNEDIKDEKNQYRALKYLQGDPEIDLELRGFLEKHYPKYKKYKNKKSNREESL